LEPFKITCVSCRAVLTVRKESMIGQIIACPRCNMMVQVLPPVGYEPSAPRPAAAPPADAAPKQIDERKAKVAAATAAVAASLFESSDALADVTPPALTPTPTHTVPSDPIFAATFDDAVESLNEPLPNAAPAAAVPPPPPAAVVPDVSRWATLKFPAMIAGGAIAGAALVATALTLLNGDDPAPVAAARSDVAPAIAEQPTVDVAPADPTAQPIIPAEPPAAASTNDNSATSAAVADASANIEPTADNPFAESPPTEDAAAESTATETAAGDHQITADAAEPSPATEIGDSDAAPAEDAPAPEQAAEAELPKLRIDPLEIDPEGLNLSTLYNGPPKDPLAASQLPAEESAELSVPAAHEPPPEAAPAAGGPPPAAGAGAVRRDEQAVGAPGAAIAALLARKTPELKVNQMPLCRLLDLSVQLSGVPISVAPEQLRLAAISAGQPATADVKDATIEEFLIAALKPLRLQPVIINEQIVLIRGTNNPRSERTFPVDDLASDEAAIERLATTIQKVVAPDSWQAAGGDGTIAIDGKQLKIDAGEAIQYDVLLLLERSRAALGKSPRSKYPAPLIGADAAPIALAERLSAPATFTFSQYTPLREIFRHWQEEMEVAVLVDWPALTDLRLWPNTRIACSSAGKPWDAALDEVLTPLGLAWRPIDKRTIEITTLEKAAAEPLLEIYRLNPEAMAGFDDLTAQLDQLVAANGSDASGQAEAIVLVNEHHLLLVRQPAMIQRRIAAWLAEKQLSVASAPANRH
jgi:hypothetical protein